MTILINDEPKVVAEGTTVNEVVLSVLHLQPTGMAIAVNDALVPRTRWENTTLNENDKMLVIKASKGG